MAKKYVPNQNTISDKRKKKKEEEKNKNAGYRYDKTGKKITSAKKSEAKTASPVSNAGSSSQRKTSGSLNTRPSVTASAAQARDNASPLANAVPYQGKAQTPIAPINTSDAAIRRWQDAALDYLYKKHMPTDQQIMQGIGNNPNKDVGSREYTERSNKSVMEFYFNQMAESNDPAAQAVVEYWSDLGKIHSGDMNPLTAQRDKIDKAKESGRVDNWFRNLTGIEKYTNQEEIDQAEAIYQDYLNNAKLYGYGNISGMLEAEGENSVKNNIVSRHTEYTRDQVEEDLALIDSRALGWFVEEDDYNSARRRVDAYFGDNAAIAAQNDPKGWMQAYLDRYDANEAAFNEYANRHSGVAGTEAEFGLDKYIRYQDAVESTESGETRMVEYNETRAKLHEELKSNVDYSLNSQYSNMGEYYTPAAESENGIEQWNAASMLNDLINASGNDAMYAAVEEEIYRTPHNDLAMSYIDHIKYMSDEDRSDALYILNTEGLDALLDFIDNDIWWSLGRQYEEDVAKTISKTIDAHPAAAIPLNVLAFGTNVLNQGAGVATQILPMLPGVDENFNEYSPYFSFGRITEGIRGETLSQIEEAIPNFELFGTNVPGFFYNVGTSVADSAISRALFQYGSAAAMGVGTYNSELRKNIEENGYNRDAVIDAHVMGGLETLTEHIGMESWFKIKDSANPWKAFIKQAGVESGEEVLNFAGGNLYDWLKYGDGSAESAAVKELIAMGYDPAEAFRLISAQKLREGIETAASGFFAGAFSAAAPAMQSGSTNRQIGRQMQVGDLEGLVRMTEGMDLSGSSAKTRAALIEHIAQQNFERDKAQQEQQAQQESSVDDIAVEQPDAIVGEVAEEQQDASELAQEVIENQQTEQEAVQEAIEAEAILPEEMPMPEADSAVDEIAQEAIQPVEEETADAADEKAAEPDINVEGAVETAVDAVAQEESSEETEEQGERLAEEMIENPSADVEAVAEKIANDGKKGKPVKITAGKLGALYREAMMNLNEYAQDVLRESVSFNVARELRRGGIKGQSARDLAMSILRIQDGTFTKEDMDAVNGNSVARGVLLDWTAKDIAAKAAEGRVRQFEGLLKPRTEEAAATAKVNVGEAEEEFDAVVAEVDEKDANKLVSEGETSTVDGSKVEIIGFAAPEASENGSTPMVRVVTEDGTERAVAADSIAYGTNDSDVYKLSQYAARYGEKGDVFYNGYQPGQDVAAYARAFDTAFNRGSDGRNIDALRSSGTVDVLPSAVVSAAYDLGRSQRVERGQRTQEVRSRKGAGVPVGRVITSGIRGIKLNTHQKASINAMKPFAKALGINIVLVSSKADASGRYTAEQGSWKAGTRTLTVDIHAGSNYAADLKYAMMDTVGHELTHYIRQFADSALWDEYQDFVISNLESGLDIENEIKDTMARVPTLDRDGAIEEIIADASARALSRITEQQIADLANSNPSLFEKIKSFIAKWIADIKALISKAYGTSEAKSNRFAQAMEAQLDEMAEMWNTLLAVASQNANATHDTTLEATITEATEGAVNTDGEELFSLRTMREDKAYYRELLTKHGKMAASEINALFRTIDNLMAEIEENRHILDFGENIDSNKRSFAPVKPNSDPLYQVSVDFSTLCRKRLLQQVCQERLEAAMGRTVTKAERVAIRDELIKLQQMGKQIEVACALCYVESARLKSPAQIQRFMDNRAEVIRNYFARRNEGVKAAMQKAEADYRRANNIGDEPIKNLSTAVAKKVRGAKNAPIANYQVTAQEQKTVDKAMSMSVSDFTTADSLWELKRSDPVLFDIYTSYIRNATKSKGIEGDTPWKAGDSSAISDTLIEKMNQENGLRTQSWSDFQAFHILDYIASVIELSTRNAKMQAYTKVPAYVKLMGETGIMINMSLIPTAKFDGTLQYDDVEGFVHEIAFELRKRYPETAGTICIGIDDVQIAMLLGNDDIDYVIPYHRSGMDAATRRKMHIPTWNDYESQQNEKPLGKNAGKSPKFSEWFDYATAVRDAREANNTPEGRAAIAAGDVMYGAKIAMQNAAQRYLNLCAERNLAPKFQKFTEHDGYWKLLVDRKMINNETGEIIEQKTVQPKFNEDTLIEICRDEVSRFNQNNADFNYAVDAVLNAYEDGTLGKVAKSQRVQQAVKNHEDWMTIQAAIGSRQQAESDVKFQTRDRNEQERNRALREGILETAATESETDIMFQLRDPYNASDRELLADALENLTANAAELDILRRYQKKIGKLNEKQAQLEAAESRLAELKQGDVKANRDEITKLTNNVRTISNQISRMDGELLKLEVMAPVKNLADRQRAIYTEQLKARSDERIRNYRERTRAATQEKIRAVREREAERRGDLREAAAERQRKAVEHTREVGERRVERMKENQGKEKYRARILKDVRTLHEWIARATDKRHVPKFLKKPLADFLLSIDYNSARSLKGGAATKADVRMTEALENLRRSIANAHNQENLETAASEHAEYIDLPDQYLEMFDELVGDIKRTLETAPGATETPLMLMTSAQLEQLSRMMRTLLTSVRKMNSFHANMMYDRASSASESTQEEMYSMKAREKTNKGLETLNRMFNWKNTTPYNVFQKLGKGGKAIFAALQDGWDKMARNSALLIEFAKNTFSAKQAKAWSNDIKNIELSNGETVRMTAAQAMSFYCLSKRDQAVGHLKGGGIRIADIKGRRGNVITQAKHYVLSDADIARINGSLTAEQRSVADKLQRFMNTQCTEWGNAISMARFGYEMFTEDNYFPIVVDGSILRGVNEKRDGGKNIFRLLNMSSMKPLTPKANNAIVIDNIFDVFSDHASDIAKYNALALPILDFIKWYNFMETTEVLDKNGQPTGQIVTKGTRTALEHAYGKNATEYLMNFISDLNAEHDGGRNDGFLSKIMGNAKAAAVGFNARVYLLQITSLPRAAYVINPKYLLKGMMKLKSLNPVSAIKGTEAQEKIGILKWKQLGFYNTDIARSTRGMVRRDDTFITKLRDIGMKPAAWGDNWTSNIIYEAAKAEMADKHPSLKPGTAAYETVLNNRVREIIYRTQVVDSTMTRSENMRSKGMMQIFTAFMSEPTLTVNMLNESIQEAITNRRKGVSANENLRSVGGKVVRAAATFAFTAAFAAVVEALFDAIRDDDEYETFEEKFMQGLFGERVKDADTFAKKLKALLDGNLADNYNIFAMFPVLNEVASMAKGFEGNTMIHQTVNQFFDAKDAVVAWMKGDRPAYNAIYNLLKVAGSVSGVAAQNATRDGISMYNTFLADAWGTPKIQTYSDSKSDAAAAFYAALRDGDEKRASWVLERAAIRGFSEEDFKQSIRKCVKADYISGEIDADTATKYLVDYGDVSADDAYWNIKEWDTVLPEGENFSKYTALYDAVASNDRSAATAAYNELINHGSKEATVNSQLTAKYNNGEATTILNLQLRSDSLHKSADFDAFVAAILSGRGIESEVSRLRDAGYNTKEIMSAINSVFGNSSYRYMIMKKYNSSEAAVLLDRILDAYEAVGLDRQDEIVWINENWHLPE